MPDKPDRDPRMREVRANLAGFAQSTSQLVNVLYDDVDRTPGLRSLMGEALQLNAQATLLARNVAGRSDLEQVRRDYSEIDQRWRLLSFRLKQLRNLTRQAAERIQRCDEAHRRASQSLNFDSQPDREAIVQQAAALSA